jgi:protein gp37
LNAILQDHNPRCWFVNSLSDIFHPNVSTEIVRQHFDVFAKCPWQEFRCLTKRAKRLVELDAQIAWTPNVQMGVSVEDIKHLYRIALLGKCGVRHKFISFEPWLSPWPYRPEHSIQAAFPLNIDDVQYGSLCDLLKAAGISTCIVGGEACKNKEAARYFSLHDANYILEQADAAGAHAVLKQLGDRQSVASNTYCLNRHGRDRSIWPKQFQRFSQEWPFLQLPTYKDIASRRAN